MNWINRAFKWLFSRDNMLMLLVTLVLLAMINFTYIYFSPRLIKYVPFDFIYYSSTCYRTLYHRLNAPKATSDKYEVILGDSYSEGAGDEFISGSSKYGFFNKLPEHKEQFVVFGRSGYGSIGPAIEEERCGKLLKKFTTFDYNRDDVSRLTFMFYEGNDLDNTLHEIRRKREDGWYTFYFLFPVFYYIGEKNHKFFQWLEQSQQPKEQVEKVYPKSDTGVEFGVYPQGASLELSEEETTRALDGLERTLLDLGLKFPKAKKQFLYLPSNVSSYEFTGPIRVQSYKKKPYFEADGAENRRRSDELRARLKRITEETTGWKFCDATPYILDITSKGQTAHGPIDMKHFNKAGYEAVLKAYQECFPESAN